MWNMLKHPTLRLAIALVASVVLGMTHSARAQASAGPPVLRNVFTTNQPQDVRNAVPVVLEAGDGLLMTNTGVRYRMLTDTTVARTNRSHRFWGNQTNYGDWMIFGRTTVTGDVASAGTFYGSGAGLTNLDASALALGIVPAGRLPAELAWTNRPQTFFGNLEVRTNITTTNLIVRSTATVDALRFTTNTVRIGSDVLPAMGTANYFSGVFIGGHAGPLAGNAEQAVAIGWRAGQSATNSIYGSVIIGPHAGEFATNALYGLIAGFMAGRYGANLQESIAIGRLAGFEAFYSPYSVLVGGFAGRSATNALRVTMVGYEAGAYAAGGTNMVAIGVTSGRNATNSGWSVFIGDGAGRNFEDSPYNIVIGGIRSDATSRVDRLMIHSRDTTIPLLYGEFDNRLLRVHGWLDVTNKVAASLFEGNAAGLTNLPVSGIAAGGTRDGTTFLRGDGQWAVPPGGGGGGGTTEYVASANTNHIVVTTNLPVYTLDVGNAVARTNRAQTFYGDLSVRTNLDVLNTVTAATGIFSGRIIGNLVQATNLPVSGISASGTRSSSTYLRGDATWATVTMPAVGIFNVIDYGALPNIHTNNAEAFRAAIAAASSQGGGIVYVPEGTWFVGSSVYGGAAIWLTNSIVLRGAGQSTTRIKLMTNNMASVSVVAATNTQNIIIEHLTIDGSWRERNLTPSNGSEDCGVRFPGSGHQGNVRNATIRNVTIVNCAKEAINHDYSDYFILVDSFIADNGLGGLASHGYYQYVVGNVFSNNAWAAIAVGETNHPGAIGDVASRHMIVANNRFVTNAVGLFKRHGGPAVISDNIFLTGPSLESNGILLNPNGTNIVLVSGGALEIIGNYLGGGVGIHFAAEVGSFPQGVKLAGNYFATHRGVIVLGGDYIDITDNFFHQWVNGSSTCITIAGATPFRFNIANNYFDVWNYAVQIGSGVSGIRIVDNHVSRVGATAFQIVSGVSNVISRNTVISSAADSVVISAGTWNHISDNLFWDDILINSGTNMVLNNVCKDIYSTTAGAVSNLFVNNVIRGAVSGTSDWARSNIWSMNRSSSGGRPALAGSVTILPDSYTGPIVLYGSNTLAGHSFLSNAISPLFIGNAEGLTNLPVSGIAASGTRDGTTFLRGDGTWAVPAGGGGGGTTEYVASANTNHIVVTTNLPVYTLDVGNAVARTNRAQTFYGNLEVRTNVTATNIIARREVQTSGLRIDLAGGGAPVWVMGAYGWTNVSSDTEHFWDFSAPGQLYIIPPGTFQVLGNMGVVGQLSANTFTGNGAGITSLNANNLASGTVPDARLGNNVARTNRAQTFYGDLSVRTNLDVLNTVTAATGIFSGRIIGNLVQATNLPVSGISASGTRDSTTFLRGDGQWAVPPAGTTEYVASADTNNIVISTNLPVYTLNVGNAVARTNRAQTFYGNLTVRTNLDVLNTVTAATGVFSGRIIGNLAQATNLPVTGISASGTPGSSTFLRGDGTWATPPGGGGGGLEGWAFTNVTDTLYDVGDGEFVIWPRVDMSGATTVMPRTIQYGVELTNSVTEIFGPDPGSGSFMAGDVLVMILRVGSSGPFPIYAGRLSSIYRSYFTDHEGHLWMAYSGPKTAIAVFRNTGAYWHLESFSEMNAALPQRPGLAPVTVNTNAVVWMRPAVAPGSEIISMWAQAPNSGTSPAASPGASFPQDGAVAFTTTNNFGQRVAGNLLFRTNASGVTTRIRYSGNVAPAVRALVRVYHVLAVDHPADLNVYAGWISANAGTQSDWPQTATTHAIFYSTNGVWHAFVRKSSSEAVNVPIGVSVEAGRAYRLSINRNADGSLNFFINNRLVATVNASDAPPDDDAVFPVIWTRTKSATTLDWRWYKSQVDYMPDPWP
jgi:hypothetical protein